jgi:hypothetical protein
MEGLPGKDLERDRPAIRRGDQLVAFLGRQPRSQAVPCPGRA